MKKYVISKVTTYDADQLLHETKVGTGNKEMDLLYSCWGKTREESRTRAKELIDFLNDEKLNG